ncbi:hypothetical protein DRQ09_09285 [candidate division KSB1 bacterium]|nr:MAG: hypothetical protein DRQ09_09285 [candidate division KSB1 bacterium]
MEDHRLRTFFTVVKNKSFSKAARELYMTQPAVSFHIKQLEKHFNTTLFIRGHHKIKLTRDGALLLKHTINILDAYEALDRDFNNGSRNSIRIKM